MTVYLDAPGFEIGGQAAAEVALGILLRAYRFDKYRTKKDDADNGEEPAKIKVTIVTSCRRRRQEGVRRCRCGRRRRHAGARSRQ